MSTLYIPQSPRHNIIPMNKAVVQVNSYFIQRIMVNRKHIPKDIRNLCAEYLTDKHAATYKATLHNLLFNNRCIGVYDFQAKQWRTAVYINHWTSLQKIAVRYVESCYSNPELTCNFCTIDKFPVNFIMLDDDKCKRDNSAFENISNVIPMGLIKWTNGQIIKKD